MEPEVKEILLRVKDTADFGYVDFSDINATNTLGDNALHCVIVWGDYEAARILIENGIDFQKHGEHGHTPLHQACSFNRKDIVELLLEHGADPFARTEGDLPFTLARIHSHNEICDLLNQYMKGKSDNSFETHNKHMERLNESIADLEQRISECEKKGTKPNA